MKGSGRKNDNERVKGSAALWILIAVLALGGVGYYAYQKYTKTGGICLETTKVCTHDIRYMCSPDGKERRQVSSSCSCGEDAQSLAAEGWTDCPNQEVSSADTKDWKTYRNEEFGFELKHPAEFEIKQYDEGFSVRPAVSDLWPTDSYTLLVVGTAPEVTSAMRYKYTVGDSPLHVRNSFYYFPGDYGGYVGEVIAEILSTFKFIN